MSCNIRLDLRLDEDLAYYVRAPRVMGKITERDQKHGPSPQVLNGMDDAEWNGESSDPPSGMRLF
jgi:hypothetical protein